LQSDDRLARDVPQSDSHALEPIVLLLELDGVQALSTLITTPVLDLDPTLYGMLAHLEVDQLQRFIGVSFKI